MKRVTHGSNGVHDVNFDVLSFIFGKLNCGSNFNDVVSYLLGKTVSAVWKTITNVAIASFTAVSSTLRELVVDITPVQFGTGDPSPTNVRPISGWTAANVTRTGINVWDEEYYGGGYILDDGSVVTSGYGNRILSKNYIPVKPNTTYFIRTPYNIASYGIRIAQYSAEVQSAKISVADVYSASFTTNEKTHYIKFNTNTQYGSATYNNDISINYPSSYHAYYAYDADSTTIPISWSDTAGTIYKGYLRYDGNGVWTPVATGAIADLGSLSWTKNASWGYYASLSGVYGVTLMCSCYKPVTGTPSPSTNEICYYNNLLRVGDLSYADADAFTAGVTGQKVLYNLETEVVGTPITTTEPTTLLGINNIFADCGNINTITYRER